MDSCAASAKVRISQAKCNPFNERNIYEDFVKMLVQGTPQTWYIAPDASDFDKK